MTHRGATYARVPPSTIPRTSHSTLPKHLIPKAPCSPPSLPPSSLFCQQPRRMASWQTSPCARRALPAEVRENMTCDAVDVMESNNGKSACCSLFSSKIVARLRSAWQAGLAAFAHGCDPTAVVCVRISPQKAAASLDQFAVSPLLPRCTTSARSFCSSDERGAAPNTPGRPPARSAIAPFVVQQCNEDPVVRSCTKSVGIVPQHPLATALAKTS